MHSRFTLPKDQTARQALNVATFGDVVGIHKANESGDGVIFCFFQGEFRSSGIY